MPTFGHAEKGGNTVCKPLIPLINTFQYSIQSLNPILAFY